MAVSDRMEKFRFTLLLGRKDEITLVLRRSACPSQGGSSPFFLPFERVETTKKSRKTSFCNGPIKKKKRKRKQRTQRTQRNTHLHPHITESRVVPLSLGNPINVLVPSRPHVCLSLLLPKRTKKRKKFLAAGLERQGRMFQTPGVGWTFLTTGRGRFRSGPLGERRGDKGKRGSSLKEIRQDRCWKGFCHPHQNGMLSLFPPPHRSRTESFGFRLCVGSCFPWLGGGGLFLPPRRPKILPVRTRGGIPREERCGRNGGGKGPGQRGLQVHTRTFPQAGSEPIQKGLPLAHRRQVQERGLGGCEVRKRLRARRGGGGGHARELQRFFFFFFFFSFILSAVFLLLFVPTDVRRFLLCRSDGGQINVQRFVPAITHSTGCCPRENRVGVVRKDVFLSFVLFLSFGFLSGGGFSLPVVRRPRCRGDLSPRRQSVHISPSLHAKHMQRGLVRPAHFSPDHQARAQAPPHPLGYRQRKSLLRSVASPPDIQMGFTNPGELPLVGHIHSFVPHGAHHAACPSLRVQDASFGVQPSVPPHGCRMLQKVESGGGARGGGRKSEIGPRRRRSNGERRFPVRGQLQRMRVKVHSVRPMQLHQVRPVFGTLDPFSSDHRARRRFGLSPTVFRHRVVRNRRGGETRIQKRGVPFFLLGKRFRLFLCLFL